ncbi:MAG: HRDC domain-containing protein, partial [Acetatifactor sp.]|nr:HRDC domain-containing protein [Acetatifactor sp.]
VYGALQTYSEDRIKQIIRELEQREYLTATPDKYAVLKVRGRAQDLLDGRDSLLLRWAKEDEKAAARTRKARKSDVLNHRGLELFEALKRLRMELARAESVPPYVVFSDKTLIEMCVCLPFDKGEMLEVSGVGERKYERYGDAFLSAIREFSQGRKEKTYFGEQGAAKAIMELSGNRSAGKPANRRAADRQIVVGEVFDKGFLDGDPSDYGALDNGVSDRESEDKIFSDRDSTYMEMAYERTSDQEADVQSAARKKKIKVQKQSFMLSSIRAAEFRPTDVCLATELAEELNRLADLQTVKKLSGAEILRYAVAQGWVQEVYQEGQWRKLVTEAGDKAGFFLGKRVSQHGTEYEVVYPLSCTHLGGHETLMN